jgi:hypothetical protein
MVLKTIEKEIERHQIQVKVLKPLLSWFLKNLLPYIGLFIGINFFCTILAVFIVLYVAQRRK